LNNKIYAELLGGNFKVLGYYADELCAAKSDFDFFRIIAQNIVPLIRQSPAFEFFYLQSVKEKDAYLKLRADLEVNAPQEIEQIFVSLKETLEAAGLLFNANIKQQLDDITLVFLKKNAYAIPSYLEVVRKKLAQLLEDICDIGRVDIVEKYATITYRDSVIQNAEDRLKTVKKPYIKQFSFASTLSELDKLNDIWRVEEIQLFWVAWEYFELVEWCWNTPFSFFDDKTEDYQDYQLRNTSVQLLSIHHNWLELNKIKQGNYIQQSSYLFRREVFLKLLKLIINTITLKQAISPIKSDALVTDREASEPYKVELKLHYTKLLLIVQWFKDGNEHVYIVSSFQDGSGPYNFMKALLNDAHLNTPVDIRKVSKTSGGTVAKYFKWMKINNIIGSIFFNKRKTHTAAMIAECIYGSDLSQRDLAELKTYIKGLKTDFPPLGMR
jgi:hypothetical protein